jgi:hypothetical protein
MLTTIGRRFVLAFLVLALFNFIVHGQARPAAVGEGVLVGVVADKTENAPIPFAFVYIHGPYKKARIDTPISIDNAGQFRISLTPGLYDVFVAAAGFAPTCTVVSIRSGEVTRFDPRLGPDLEHSEE